MYIIVAKSGNEYYSALFAAQVYPLESDTLIRVINVTAKIVYPPINGIFYQQRCYGWFDLPIDEQLPLSTYLELHPEIKDLDTNEKLSAWYELHPSYEPPVDRRNTLAGLYDEYPELKSMTREQKSKFLRDLREKKRALYAERIAKNSKI